VIRISDWKLQKHDITSTVFLESLCVFNVLLWFSGRARCWKNSGDGDQISCKPRCCRLPVCDAGAGYQRWTRSAREAKHLEALWLVSLMAGIGSWPPFLEGGGCCFFVTSCFCVLLVLVLALDSFLIKDLLLSFRSSWLLCSRAVWHFLLRIISYRTLGSMCVILFSAYFPPAVFLALLGRVCYQVAGVCAIFFKSSGVWPYDDVFSSRNICCPWLVHSIMLTVRHKAIEEFWCAIPVSSWCLWLFQLHQCRQGLKWLWDMLEIILLAQLHF
jgi:hypothetical protein